MTFSFQLYSREIGTEVSGPFSPVQPRWSFEVAFSFAFPAHY